MRNYQVWFKEEQSRIAAGDPSRTALLAFPITTAKVAAFLHNKSTQEKVSLAYALSPCHLTERSCLVSCSSSGEAGPRWSKAPRWASPALRRSSMPWRTTGSIMSMSIPKTTRPESVSGGTCRPTHLSQPRSITNQAGLRSPRQSRLPGPPLVSSQLATTSIVVIADGGCTRHVLQGGAFPVLALGADRLLGEASRLCWSARPCDAAALGGNHVSWRELSYVAVV